MRFGMFLQIALVTANPAADIARKLLRLHVHAIHVPLKIARLQETLVTMVALKRPFQEMNAIRMFRQSALAAEALATLTA